MWNLNHLNQRLTQDALQFPPICCTRIKVTVKCAGGVGKKAPYHLENDELEFA